MELFSFGLVRFLVREEVHNKGNGCSCGEEYNVPDSTIAGEYQSTLCTGQKTKNYSRLEAQ